MKTLSVVGVLFLLLACQNDNSIDEKIVMPEQSNPTEIKQTETKLVESVNKERIAEVRVTVPDSRWSIAIVNVTQTDQELVVYCQLTQSDMMGMMVISEVVDAVKFEAKDLPVKYYIKGKTWGWENSEPYTFLSQSTKNNLVNGEPIPFERIAPSKPGGAKRQGIEM